MSSLSVWTKNLHIKSFSLLPIRLFFMSRWKFTHQVYYIVISCQFFLTKVHIYWSSFLLWYQVSSIRRRNKKCMSSLYSFINQEGLVMTRLKELGRSGNYVFKIQHGRGYKFLHSQRGGIFWNYFVFVQPKQCMFGTVTRWRSRGVPIEKIRTIWTNFARFVSTSNGNQRKQLL